MKMKLFFATILAVATISAPSLAKKGAQQNPTTQTPLQGVITGTDGKSYLSWDQLHKDSQKLAELVRDKGPFKGIVAVARGGLIPATIVAHRLKIKKMEIFSLTSYNGDQQTDSFEMHKEFKDDGKWLVVDEISDSGKTMEKLREYLPNAHFAVVYARPKGRPAVDTVAVMLPQDDWTVLPWEED